MEDVHCCTNTSMICSLTKQCQDKENFDVECGKIISWEKRLSCLLSLFQPVLLEGRSVKLPRNVKRISLMTCLAVDLTRSTVHTQRGVSGV